MDAVEENSAGFVLNARKHSFIPVLQFDVNVSVSGLSAG